MKCRAWVADRTYSGPGPCRSTRGVETVRWSPDGLRAFTGRLCLIHRKRLEAGGTILLDEPKTEVAAR